MERLEIDSSPYINIEEDFKGRQSMAPPFRRSTHLLELLLLGFVVQSGHLGQHGSLGAPKLLPTFVLHACTWGHAYTRGIWIQA